MEAAAFKLELIEWLTKLDDEAILENLKMIKDAEEAGDWWDDLTEAQKAGIKRGLKDIEKGRVISHEEVKMKYGL